MGYTHGKQWTEEEIGENILLVSKVLNINRMPSTSEMGMVLGSSSLPNVVAKSGGFKKWADKLKLDIKISETQTGKGFEELAIKLLEDKGYIVQRMSTKYPFDLLVNECISVDVKAGRPYMSHNSRVHTVGINKKYATCNLYLVFALNEIDQVERTFIIPGCDLKHTSMNFGENSIYNIYVDRWDLIKKYDQFYNNLNSKIV